MGCDSDLKPVYDKKKIPESHYALYASESLNFSKRLEFLEEQIDLFNKMREPYGTSKEAIIDESLHRIRSLEEQLAETRKVSFYIEI